MQYLARIVGYGGHPAGIEWFDTYQEAKEYMTGLTGEIYKMIEEIE